MITAVRSLSLHTSDGQTLAADIAEAQGERRGAAVLCHPHPEFGGNRFNPVVGSLFEALPAAGFTALRFDFRSAHDAGVGERLDVFAALDALGGESNGAHVPVPRFVVGYSFGAVVALTTGDPRIAGIVAIAPPLGPGIAAPTVPVLVLTPGDDQFFPPDRARPIVAEWPNATFEVLEGTDHFLHGLTDEVTERSVRWLTEHLST